MFKKLIAAACIFAATGMAGGLAQAYVENNYTVTDIDLTPKSYFKKVAANGTYFSISYNYLYSDPGINVYSMPRALNPITVGTAVKGKFFIPPGVSLASVFPQVNLWAGTKMGFADYSAPLTNTLITNSMYDYGNPGAAYPRPGIDPIGAANPTEQIKALWILKPYGNTNKTDFYVMDLNYTVKDAAAYNAWVDSTVPPEPPQPEYGNLKFLTPVAGQNGVRLASAQTPYLTAGVFPYNENVSVSVQFKSLPEDAGKYVQLFIVTALDNVFLAAKYDFDNNAVYMEQWMAPSFNLHTISPIHSMVLASGQQVGIELFRGVLNMQADITVYAGYYYFDNITGAYKYRMLANPTSVVLY